MEFRIALSAWRQNFRVPISWRFCQHVNKIAWGSTCVYYRFLMVRLSGAYYVARCTFYVVRRTLRFGWLTLLSTAHTHINDDDFSICPMNYYYVIRTRSGVCVPYAVCVCVCVCVCTVLQWGIECWWVHHLWTGEWLFDCLDCCPCCVWGRVEFNMSAAHVLPHIVYWSIVWLFAVK